MLILCHCGCHGYRSIAAKSEASDIETGWGGARTREKAKVIKCRTEKLCHDHVSKEGERKVK